MFEWKTEEIVRQHFAQFANELIVEEKSSSEASIRKFLQSASKSGTGRGVPDFIIRFKDTSELIVVIECKPDRAKHRSPQLDQYVDYAVDGALLYSSHLSRGFDVLSIAVSGVARGAIEISHFLQLKNGGAANPIFGDSLLTPDDYVQGYRSDPAKYRADFDELQKFLRRLNKELHSDKVSASNRSLLISAILIALSREPFRLGYQSENDPVKLADRIVTDAITALEHAGVGGPSLPVLTQCLGFVKTHTVLTSTPLELKRIVREIDVEVNSFIKNHAFTDVLGNLYVEFLKYGNNDKALGIVLTPPHITELFVALAGVHENSVVYDNCAGTGGFLISAMKHMINQAQGSSAIEQKIKSDRIYGVELQDDIYSLAVSNMVIHQDGKSNVRLGDCFDPGIKSWIASKRPTHGLLNPPYSSESTDRCELEFVLNNLEALTHGSTCVAIVPLQSVLAQKGKNGTLKRDLLKDHTLEAVLSMPDDLFFNSKVSVGSCAVVITAHRPHPASKSVFLGYFKDDGFVKRRPAGRIDGNETWQSRKQHWLDLYFGKRNVPGESVNVKLTAKDEWAAEAHMETDYSKLNARHFEETLLNYSTFLFGNGLRDDVSKRSHINDGSLDLDVGNWKWFAVKNLFDVSGTKTTTLLDLEIGGDGPVPYVTTQSANNGVRRWFASSTETGGVLTVDSAVAGFCAYQEQAFSASDHVEKLTPKFSMSPSLAMFLTTVLNLEQYRFCWGRKRNQMRIKQSMVKLPATALGSPDYDFMSAYIERIPYSSNV